MEEEIKLNDIMNVCNEIAEKYLNKLTIGERICIIALLQSRVNLELSTLGKKEDMIG